MSTTKPYICFFNSHREWGGGEKWHYETSLQIARKGYPVLFFAHRKSSLYTKLKQSRFLLKAIAVKNLSFLNPVKVLYITFMLKKYNVKAIIIALPSDVKAAGIAAKLAGVPKIIYRRGTALAIKNSLLNRYLFKHVLTDVIANSEEIKNRILQRNPLIMQDSKIHVIYNGVVLNGNFSRFSNQLTNRRDKIILGNAGRLVEQKGQITLIQLAIILRQKQIPFEMRIAGDGPLKNELMQEVQKNHLQEVVHFYDFVEDIYHFLHDIDIFLFPSLHEGSSNVLLEAMAMKKPIVAYRISSIPEIITHESTGLLSEFNNLDDYAAQVERLIREPDLREQLASRAHKLVEAKFNHLHQFRQVIRIIHDN